MTWLLVLQLSAAASNYAIPDPVKTPGTVHLMTTSQVCAVKWGLDERRVTDAMRRRVGLAYGLPKSEWHQYKFDHLISRSMGGADADQNLWFQPTDQARVKDRLEVWFDRAVCDGRVSIDEARRALASDWRVAYEVYIGPLPALNRKEP